MIGSTRSVSLRPRVLLASLAATAALVLGLQVMAPASADAMRRTTSECDAYVATAVHYFNKGDYGSYSWNMNQAEICYAE